MAIVVAIFGALVVVRMLILGGASADCKGFRREEQPAVYWTIVLVAVLIDAFFFYLALTPAFRWGLP